MINDSKEELFLTESEEILVELTLGIRLPANEKEELLAKQIHEIRDRDNIVEIPKEWP